MCISQTAVCHFKLKKYVTESSAGWNESARPTKTSTHQHTLTYSSFSSIQASWDTHTQTVTYGPTPKLKAVVSFFGVRFWWVYCVELWCYERQGEEDLSFWHTEVFVSARGGWKPSIHVPLKQLLLSMCARKQRGWFISVCVWACKGYRELITTWASGKKPSGRF